MQTTAYFDTKENGVRLIITGESQAESALLMLLNHNGAKAEFVAGEDRPWDVRIIVRPLIPLPTVTSAKRSTKK